MKGSWEGKVRKAGGLELPVPLPPSPPPTHTHLRICAYSPRAYLLTLLRTRPRFIIIMITLGGPPTLH